MPERAKARSCAYLKIYVYKYRQVLREVKTKNFHIPGQQLNKKRNSATGAVFARECCRVGNANTQSLFPLLSASGTFPFRLDGERGKPGGPEGGKGREAQTVTGADIRGKIPYSNFARRRRPTDGCRRRPGWIIFAKLLANYLQIIPATEFRLRKTGRFPVF